MAKVEEMFKAVDADTALEFIEDVRKTIDSFVKIPDTEYIKIDDTPEPPPPIIREKKPKKKRDIKIPRVWKRTKKAEKPEDGKTESKIEGGEESNVQPDKVDGTEIKNPEIDEKEREKDDGDKIEPEEGDKVDPDEDDNKEEEEEDGAEDEKDEIPEDVQDDKSEKKLEAVPWKGPRMKHDIEAFAAESDRLFGKIRDLVDHLIIYLHLLDLKPDVVADITTQKDELRKAPNIVS